MSYVVRVREPVDTLVGENGTPKLDPSDPRVRKIVYSMYRDMLSNRNNEANIFISQKDPACVTQDLGVVPILESIIRQGTTSTGGSSGGSIPIPQAPPLPPTNGTLGIPPPPPMGPSGLLPAVRLSTEIGPLNKGPPLAIQGSMLKEKKPFTYTPGGIDLSEIRSPRMAKRIQMNAAAEGVTSVPAIQTHSGQGISAHHPYLPPAALAAMQPQLPVAVFPQGALNTQSLHRPSKSIDYAPPQPSNHQRQSSLPSQLTHQIQNNNVVIPSPPPPPPPPTLVQEVRQVMSPQMSGSKLSSSGGQPMSLASVMMNQSIRSVQQAPRESQVHPHVMDSCRQDQQTKVQAVSQQIGSNYIPPVLGPVVGERSQTPQMNTSPSVKKNPLSLGSIDSDSDRDINRTSSVSTTPQLNKVPTPWLNAHNRMTQQQSPSYVVIPSPSSQNCTPWGPSLTTGRTIPVSIVRDEELSWDEIEGKSNNLQKFQSQPASSSINGRAFPIQMSCGSPTDHSAQSTSISGGSSTPLHTVTRMIPIQIQGQVTQISVTPQRQQQPNYNSPTGLFSSHRVGEHTGTQKPGNTGLNEGMSKISISQDEPYKTDPIQSKSFKVIQRITDDAEENIEEQKHKLELKGEDMELMETIKAKVDDSSLHQTTEPRFRGGHIPSRAFQALRSHLPPNPITCDELPVISTKSGPVTHNIQIRMAPESPTPTFQQHQYQTPLIDSTGQVRSISITPSSHQNQRYTAGNAPSRSFKLIQVSHPSDNPHGSASEGSSPAGPVVVTGNSPTMIPLTNYHYPRPKFNPNPSFLNNGQDSTEPNFNGTPIPESPNQQDGEVHDPNWDEYWYYYWYWANYWNSQGYESFPEGWETYCHTPTRDLQTPVSIPSKSFKNLQRVYDPEESDIGSELQSQGESGSESYCDSETDKAESEIENLNEVEDCFTITLPISKSRKLGSIVESEDEGTTEEEGGGVKMNLLEDSSEENTFMGIVEEPETPTSIAEDDDAFPDLSERSNVEIEEYVPDSTDSIRAHHHRDDRLSTIDEQSESERGLSPRVSSELEDEEEDSEDESDTTSSCSDRESSTSVIENMSADTFDGNTTAKDETATASSEEEEFDGAVEIQSTVTVRLPRKFSFTKSKSYRDVATVLIGSNQIQSLVELDGLLAVENSETNFDIVEEAPAIAEFDTSSEIEVEEEEKQDDLSTDSLTDSSTEDQDEEDIDFWGEIIGKEKEEKPLESTLKGSNENETDLLNFWDKPEPITSKFNLLQTHQKFELTDEYLNEERGFQPSNVDKLVKNFNLDIEESKLESGLTKISENYHHDESDKDLDEKDFIEIYGIENEGETEESEIANSATSQHRLSEDLTVATSDEVSDESSSKSSSATVTLTNGRDGNSSPILEEIQNKIQLNEVDEVETGSKTQPEVTKTDSTFEKYDEKLQSKDTSCTCHPVDRGGKRTENLLWRIEKFLKQSFTSLGSEEDSGVMTDQSRQMSDAETDNDEGGSSRDQPIRKRVIPPPPPPSLQTLTNETEKTSTELSLIEQQRRALNYQRAKTHSRLFQMLQEECEKEDEEEGDGEDCEAVTEVVEIDSDSLFQSKAQCQGQIIEPPLTPVKRFLPNLTDSGSLSFDSSGSLSSSSGLLSPINRDQILVDLINQFQSRHKKEQVQRRLSAPSAFPSKIFKMLHNEFGEEFYDAFDFGDEDLTHFPIIQEGIELPVPPLSHVQECVLHSNNCDSITKFEHCQSQLLNDKSSIEEDDNITAKEDDNITAKEDDSTAKGIKTLKKSSKTKGTGHTKANPDHLTVPTTSGNNRPNPLKLVQS